MTGKDPAFAAAGHMQQVLVLLLAGIVMGGLGSGARASRTAGFVAAAAESRSAAPATCQHERGPFRVSGTVVTGATGRYIPYGINITGLAHPDYAARLAGDEARIRAAAVYWCANTVRFQVGQANLVSTAGHVNHAFLDAVTTEVRFAEARGLVVVLNLQWQLDGRKQVESMPTQRSRAFWGSVAYHFGKDPNVIFDIYNQPDQLTLCGWAFWHYGGVCRGTRYLGMQALADYVRARARNLFWIEGTAAGSTLDKAWQYRITGDGPLEYSEHRPPGAHRPSTWDAEFGYLANRGHAPVVEGEWADYARSHAPWACWDNAPVSAPRFLNYLQAHKFGLIMTLLVKGQLIESDNLNDPTHFRSNWSCTDGLNQGVGHQAQQWFFRQNG